ncbi:hypothetical protein HD597_008984 [Nonomuraea thailandensis]|uniref:Uncharacterized protein n=1 Tax=Nonomuraea thailandensis TaxID=1188745 RepID=A0A9X2GMK5_9ACTN|nr:hypothetical protein [Nonomuraea thailandensis]
MPDAVGRQGVGIACYASAGPASGVVDRPGVTP